MTTAKLYDKQKFKPFQNSVSDEQFQLDWIKGIIEQIDFAYRVDVLPDYVIDIRVRRREA